MHFDETFIASAVPQARILQGTVPKILYCSIDSRMIKPDEIFIALRGAKLDGHDYLEAALDAGAYGIIIEESKKALIASIDKNKLKEKLVILVPDTLEALVSLARTWRDTYTGPVVAITGSVGKTTTKNILASIMKEHGSNYLLAQGNQNTLIGVSLNILRLSPEHAGGIFEIGINQRGEMARIISILRPTTALITGIGHSHMEGLGSLSDIALEKRDIFKYLKESNVGFVNGDQPILAQVAYLHPVIKFGLKTTNQIQARKVTVEGSSTTFTLKIYKDKYSVTLPTSHSGVVINTLAATAVAHHLGVSGSTIIKAIEKPVVVPGRFEKRILKNNPGYLINDCYNASPESMKAALLAFQNLETTADKVAILGDMLELGVDSAFWHRQLGRFLRKVPSLKHLILVGSHVEWTRKTSPTGITIEMVPHWKDALTVVRTRLSSESVVLVKGSRGIGLNNLVQELTVA